jgi:hypothetical protein
MPPPELIRADNAEGLRPFRLGKFELSSVGEVAEDEAETLVTG